MNNKRWRNAGLYALLVVVVIFLATALLDRQTTDATSWRYSQFINQVENGQVEKVSISSDRARATAKTSDGQTVLINLPNDPEMLNILQKNGVDISVSPQAEDNIWARVLSTLLIPFLLLVVLFFVLRRAQGGPGSQAMNFGKSKARVQMEPQTQVTFGDVAGIEQAKLELAEVVDFLKNADRFTAVGAKIPKGVLLVGPPGTGKTLLAKAVAGEAGVPFFSISGSEFVEMFVGVGASRVRDLFEQAKANAPCIVFIDEIDAVGRQRGAGLGGGNDEREQTLNQLLTEMDGFEGNAGIIIIAATNRPDVLDSALLRPGRFDRQISVDLPDRKGRLKILEVHARNKKLADEVDLEKIARQTPGFSGAELANLLNEAAILTARRRKDAVTMLEIDDAIDRVSIGLSKNPLLDSNRKRMTAYHEIGHALLTTILENADPLNKVTIIPRAGGIEGFSQTIPNEETIDSGLYTRAWMLDRIKVILGGRAVEAEVYGEDAIDTGAASDIGKVTQIARQMVTIFGMSDLGSVAFESMGDEVFLGRNLMPRSEYSEELASQIDTKVREIAKFCYAEARRLVSENRPLVDRLVDVLLEQETIEGDQFRKIVEEYRQSIPTANVSS